MAKKALVIDDNSNNLEVMVQLLELEGIDAISIKDPSKLASILDEAYQIVFLDLEMPNANGFSILRDLKNRANFKNVPIVAYTVHVSELNVARQSGFDGFLGKPLDVDKFPRQLSRLLKGEPVWEIP